MRIEKCFENIMILVLLLILGCTASPVEIRDAALGRDEGIATQDAGVQEIDRSVVEQDATARGMDGSQPGDTGLLTGDAYTDVWDGGRESDASIPDVGQTTDAAVSECRIERPAPTEFCTGTGGETFFCESFAGAAAENPTEVGSGQSQFAIQDLQPQSCGFEQYYGLDGFRGTPTMVVLLWAGCPFCQAQTVKLQEMHYELLADGLQVNFVIIDQAAESPPIEELTSRCNFPILQDESSIDVWGLMGGRKDDFYFYDSAGILRNFIPSTGDIRLTNYENPDEPSTGYINVKSAVLTLVEDDQRAQEIE